MYVNVRALIVRETGEGRQVLIQVRSKDGWQRAYEVPGGRLDEYEGLLDGLAREVLEETGLTLTHVEGAEDRLICITAGNTVECVSPFTAYQTLEGPVDSMGLYFLCRADGIPVAQEGETEDPIWVSLESLAALVSRDDGSFSWVDRAAVRMFLTKVGRLHP